MTNALKLLFESFMRARATPPPPPRKHQWTLPQWDGYEQTPPVCVYCTHEQTPFNEHDLCAKQ